VRWETTKQKKKGGTLGLPTKKVFKQTKRVSRQPNQKNSREETVLPELGKGSWGARWGWVRGGTRVSVGLSWAPKKLALSPKFLIVRMKKKRT